jgi:hypothetical protein
MAACSAKLDAMFAFFPQRATGIGAILDIVERKTMFM